VPGPYFGNNIVDSGFGSVASFGLEQGFKERASFPGTLGSHFEEFVDEPILTPHATPAQPPHLALPNYVHRLIALNRSSRSLEFAKPLLRAFTRRLIARWSCSMMLSKSRPRGQRGLGRKPKFALQVLEHRSDR
jgi:hypothetical protein